MSYNTEFSGSIAIDPPLSPAEIKFLTKFSRTRRMLRRNGPYSVDAGGVRGQANMPDIIAYNDPPIGQPELWCEWTPNSQGTALEWSGNTAFYKSPEWMLYIIQHFLAPGALAMGEVPGIVGGHLLNGVIQAHGERPGDRWDLVVENNKVFILDYAHGGARIRRSARTLVVPFPYIFKLMYDKLKDYFLNAFIDNHIQLDGKASFAQISADQETGAPTNILMIFSDDNTLMQEYVIGPDGKARPAGVLEWRPEDPK